MCGAARSSTIVAQRLLRRRSVGATSYGTWMRLEAVRAWTVPLVRVHLAASQDVPYMVIDTFIPLPADGRNTLSHA